MMDKSRQQFEESISNIYNIPEGNFSQYRNSFGYMDCMIWLNESWKIWQASRESLEVELPKKCNTSIAGNVKTKYYFNGVNEGIDKCKQILISNGVKIKNE
ncbi:hypothetical protein HBA43_06315 [Providencia rettgeri]|uniref:hypothetical protein n=1 Tax=Providencia rettgeri TaxID=587 RepID=UPI00141A310D|nr:hypothetical protein [Providencia rettgeri]NIA74642.1 hypothetical protein [Providencia rettgeri]NIA78025.1 hypothetical protein [Providencia rettgeri]NIB01469.1 hypothetical protein [Providencia rettgeri]NIB05392.1 hypothetical protein [Providencia rettgeri]NIB18925.1 hypothetical protein [Providencia rettgeri]